MNISTAPDPVQNGQATLITHQVLKTFAYLETLDDKSPQPVLNTSLTQLVALVSPVYHSHIVDEVLGHAAIRENRQALTRQLSTCEYQLEVHWANKVRADEAHYSDYPYASCYDGIVTAETTLIGGATDDYKQVCFIGSGPMPLTAMILKQRHPAWQVTCIEREQEALAMAREVCAKSDIDIAHVLGDANEADFAGFDCVFVASMTEGKREVLDRVAATARPGTLVAARTVEDLRHLLYDAITPDSIPEQMIYVDKTPYNPAHVNTTALYRLTP